MGGREEGGTAGEIEVMVSSTIAWGVVCKVREKGISYCEKKEGGEDKTHTFGASIPSKGLRVANNFDRRRRGLRR